LPSGGEVIYLFYGENEFEKRQAIAKLIGSEKVARHDGEDLTLAGMQEIAIGQTLFMSSSIYLISKLSENSEIWSQLPDMKFDDDRTIILVEDKIDKRTKTYKWLQKNAKVQEFSPLSDRQKPQLLKWCATEAKIRECELTNRQAEIIVDRLGFDQLRLSNFLDQLALAEKVTDDLIDNFIPLARTENVFDLFISALAGDYDKVHDIISYLESESGIDGANQPLDRQTACQLTLTH
jgi:DNA polymerase III delta subunit